MWVLHSKMRRLATTLSIWSRKKYGDIFVQIKHYEKLVRNYEENLINDNISENREKCILLMHNI